MNTQEQMESLLKDVYTSLVNGEQIPGKPGKVVVERGELLQMLEEIQNTFYAVLRAQCASPDSDGYTAEAKKKESRIINRAQAHAEDVYAASILYSDGMIGELKDLFDRTNEAFEEVTRSFRREFEAKQEMLAKQETALHAQLADMADTGKYLQLIEEENARREASKTKPDLFSAAPERAAGPEDVVINKDAEYFRWKEEQEYLAQEREKKEHRERLEAERIEQERLEAERLEAERIEQERLEAERLEAERIEQERLDAERLEQERLAREKAERLKQENLQKTQVIMPEKTADLSDPAAAAAAYRRETGRKPAEQKSFASQPREQDAVHFDDIGDDWLDDDLALPDEDVLLQAMLAGEMQTESVPGADPSFASQGRKSPQSRSENLDVLELDYMDFGESSDLAGLDELEPIPESGRGRRRSLRRDAYDESDYNDSGSSGKKSGKLKGFLLGN